jgi:hypothetical protein
MINGVERIWKAVLMALWKYYPSISLQGWRNLWKISVQFYSVLAKIQTEKPPLELC